MLPMEPSKTENVANIFGSSLRSSTHKTIYYFAFTTLITLSCWASYVYNFDTLLIEKKWN